MLLKALGKAPRGKRLERIQQSPNYANGKFANQIVTPQLTEGYTFRKVLHKAITDRNPDKKPKATIPTIKTDLKNSAIENDCLVWFGHSSYFLQINGVRFLIDPVLSGNASPIPRTTRSFDGTTIYSHNDILEIDYLLLTHDHYDHLDYPTVKKIRPKIKNIVCGLGVGSHLEYWGYNPTIISEHDWYDNLELMTNIKLHVLPARHFSGRTFKRNNTLWVSFLLETPNQKIYLGGDSGYDGHFKEIGQKFGTIDLAILEDGQYNDAWRYIHCFPQETLQAGKDLNAKRIMPVHNSKFALSSHAWYEPINEIVRLNTDNQHLVTPQIGEVVRLDDPTQIFKQWWKNLD